MYAIKSNFIAILIQQNNSSRLSSSTYDLGSLRFLALLTVSGVGSMSWSLKSNEKVVDYSHVCVSTAPVYPADRLLK